MRKSNKGDRNFVKVVWQLYACWVRLYCSFNFEWTEKNILRTALYCRQLPRIKQHKRETFQAQVCHNLLWITSANSNDKRWHSHVLVLLHQQHTPCVTHCLHNDVTTTGSMVGCLATEPTLSLFSFISESWSAGEARASTSDDSRRVKRRDVDRLRRQRKLRVSLCFLGWRLVKLNIPVQPIPSWFN